MWYIVVNLLILVCMVSYSQPKPLDDAVRTLTRQAARWTTAALQDENPMIAVLHANYGAGYLWAITDIVTSSEFEKMTGLDYIKFRDEITKAQDWATQKAVGECPSFGPPRTYLTEIGGE